jgi:hypothetical protein
MAPGQTPDEAAEDLLRLAKERFGGLSEAEARLLRAAPKGDQAVCGPSGEFNDPSNDPVKADKWGPERQVRAEIIRWLCTESGPASRIDPKGVQLIGAKVSGPLDLSFVHVPFPLWLIRCHVADEITLRQTHLPALYLYGSWVRSPNGEGMNVRGNVHLRNGFIAEGEVRLLGAEIGGNLECDGVRSRTLRRRIRQGAVRR